MLWSGVGDVAGNIGLCLPEVSAEGSVNQSTARSGAADGGGAHHTRYGTGSTRRVQRTSHKARIQTHRQIPSVNGLGGTFLSLSAQWWGGILRLLLFVVLVSISCLPAASSTPLSCVDKVIAQHKRVAQRVERRTTASDTIWTRFELARAMPNHLAGDHLNHSVTKSCLCAYEYFALSGRFSVAVWLNNGEHFAVQVPHTVLGCRPPRPIVIGRESPRPIVIGRESPTSILVLSTNASRPSATRDAGDSGVTHETQRLVRAPPSCEHRHDERSRGGRGGDADGVAASVVGCLPRAACDAVERAAAAAPAAHGALRGAGGRGRGARARWRLGGPGDSGGRDCLPGAAAAAAVAATRRRGTTTTTTSSFRRWLLMTTRRRRKSGTRMRRARARARATLVGEDRGGGNAPHGSKAYVEHLDVTNGRHTRWKAAKVNTLMTEQAAVAALDNYVKDGANPVNRVYPRLRTSKFRRMRRGRGGASGTRRRRRTMTLRRPRARRAAAAAAAAAAAVGAAGGAGLEIAPGPSPALGANPRTDRVSRRPAAASAAAVPPRRHHLAQAGCRRRRLLRRQGN